MREMPCAIGIRICMSVNVVTIAPCDYEEPYVQVICSPSIIENRNAKPRASYCRLIYRIEIDPIITFCQTANS